MSTAEQKVRWEEMLPNEFVEARDLHPVCFMPYGLAEPHGAYNALGLDWLKARELVERAAREHGGIVAPPFCWHIQDRPDFHDNGRGQGWLCDVGVRQSLSSSIPTDLFFRMVFHHIRVFDARGFRAAVLVTGHYGGLERTMRLACEYYVRRTGSPIRLAALADNEAIAPELPYRGDHAGICETSQLMELRPGLTDLTRTSVPEELGTRFAGTTFPARGEMPSRETGRIIVESQVRNLGELGRKLLATYQAKPGWSVPNANELDAIWHRFDTVTRRYSLGTYAEYRARSAPEFPGWEALGE